MIVYCGKYFTEEVFENFNTFTEILAYLNSEDNPITFAEFTEFWASLRDDEKIYFKTVDLKTGRAAYMCP